MRTNKTKDNLTWMSKMQMSYDAATSSIDNWMQDILNVSRKQYGKYTVFGIIIEAFKQLATLLFTQIVVGTKEHNILTAEQTASVRGLAQLACYKAASASSAFGTIRVTFGANAGIELSPIVFVKNHAKLKCLENALIYSISLNEDFQQIVLNDINANRQHEFIVRQGEWSSQQFVTSGESLEAFDVTERNMFVAEDSLIVKVNDELWERRLSFAEMDRNSKCYITQWSFDGKLQIVFGNGITGVMPDKNSVIDVTYLKCAGYDGNVLVKNAATFEWQDGMFDANMNAIEPKSQITIEQLTDIVGGYNGDDIETIRTNAGAINRALVLHSAESIRLFLTRFRQYAVIDVWSNTDNAIIHVVMVPNVVDKFMVAGTLTYNYWSLPLTEFMLDANDVQWLQTSIKDAKDYVLLTELKFDTVNILFYRAYIRCRRKYELQNAEDIKQSVMSVATEFIQNSWTTQKQFVSRSALIAAIEALDIVDSVDVTFDSYDRATNPQSKELSFIDTLGSINVTDKYYMPLVRNASSIEVDDAIKVLFETSPNVWSEI